MSETHSSPSNGQVARALVTGATGFIGGRLAHRLLVDGWQVHVITRPASNLSSIEELREDLVLHEHDGTAERMRSIVDESRPDVVFHLASLFLASHRPDQIAPLIASNITFGTHLLDALAATGVTRLVNTGTSWQHFQNSAYSPVCLYAATKQAFEAIVQFYVETAHLRVVQLKLFDSYGVDDPRPKLFNLLRARSETQEPLAMSPGEQLLDIVHVDDIVDAFLLAAKRLQAGAGAPLETYSVSSGCPLSLQDVVRRYEGETGRSVPVEWGARPYRSREVMVPWSAGASLPGWEPRRTRAEGFAALR